MHLRTTLCDAEEGACSKPQEASAGAHVYLLACVLTLLAIAAR